MPIKRGQRPETRKKYREAVEACDSEEYIHLNVSQIARLFNLNGTALANQLRTHYSEIIPRREAKRQKRGLADNLPRGVTKASAENYGRAVEMLRDTDLTIEQVAEKCGVSYPGLRQHIIFYHKDVEELRENKRLAGQKKPQIGKMSGTGQTRNAGKDAKNKYREGVELYRTTSLPVTEIARRIGVNVSSFRDYLASWHKELMFERRGAKMPLDTSDRPSLAGTKRYDKSTAEKYEEAIGLLKSTDTSTEAVAKKLGFTPEVLRAYIREHEPALFASLGMIVLPNGKMVLKRSYDKYKEAIEAYANSGEPLKSIASRLGLTYNSLTGFIRRNLPELIASRRKTN